MTTFKEMIDETLLHLSGYGMRNEALTHATSAVTSSASTISVASAENIGRGLIEIDDELLWVDSFDRTTNVINIPPYGRGYAGTTATSHALNSKVTIAPVFTRQQVKRAINDTILAIGGQLYGVATTTFTFSPAVNTYALPANVDNVLMISYQSIGASKEWVPVRGWRVDKSANVAEFGSTNTITVSANIDPNATVQVTYSFEPEVLEVDSDDFSTVTGLPDSCKDVVELGAAYRLLSFVDPGRLNYQSAEANANSNTVQYGSATNTAKYVYALFQQRLQDEVVRLQVKFPVRVHYTN